MGMSPSTISVSPAPKPRSAIQEQTDVAADAREDQKDTLLTYFRRIQETLIHALNSNKANWPTQIQNHALSLLRSGEITTYPALLRRIVEDVREASLANSSTSTNGKTSNGDTKKVNGLSSAVDKEKAKLAVPESVIEDALRVTRESLEAVCEIDDRGTS